MQEKIQLVLVLLIGVLVGPIIIFGVLSMADIYTADEALAYITNTVVLSAAIVAVMMLVLLFAQKKK